MNSNTFYKPDLLISTIVQNVADEDMRDRSRGFYLTQIAQCLEELSFDTLFNELTTECDFPDETLNLPMPPGAFNMKNIYLFNGDTCNIGNSQIVYWKRNYYTKGEGYLARSKNSNRDTFYQPNGNILDFHTSNAINDNSANNPRNQARGSSVENTYYFNIQNGMIMFSSACRGYAMVALHYNGVPTDIGDEPVIPNFLRQVVIDYVSEAALRTKMAKEPQRWQFLWSTYDKRLNKDGTYGPYKGSWHEALMRVTLMDEAERNSLKEYLTRKF